MSVLTSFTQMALVRSLALKRVERCLHLYTTPFLQSICHSFSVSSVEDRTADPVTAATALVIYSSVVTIVRIEPDCDGNHPAHPGTNRTFAVGADELPHDVGVFVFDLRKLLVDFVEVENEIMRLQQSDHTFMHGRLRGPLRLTKAASARHDAFERWLGTVLITMHLSE
jgi:hypothetical protein